MTLAFGMESNLLVGKKRFRLNIDLAQVTGRTMRELIWQNDLQKIMKKLCDGWFYFHYFCDFFFKLGRASLHWDLENQQQH